MGSQSEKATKRIFKSFKISLEERPDFKGEISAFLFDVAGNLLETVSVKEGKASFSSTEDELRHSRLFIAPMPDQAGELEQKPTVNMMERIGAYEPVIGHRGKLVDMIRIPSSIIDMWPICFCWIRGHVVKGESGLPICNAKVHICEVDKLWRWILKLPDLEVFRFRDDLLKIFDKPLLRRSLRPETDQSPFMAMRSGLVHLGKAALGPQPEPPDELLQTKIAEACELPINVRAALTSASALNVRKTLIDNVHLIIPRLCLLPWWRYRCDEIAVVETDALGRFRSIIAYLCKGDKPDLYFWVEYQLGIVLETVYRPSIACHTYWNYACGSDVTISVWDERVPACNNGPDLPGCVVQILSIGREISMSEIRGPGVATADEGLTTDDQPLGGKLEPRVWFSRTALRDDRHIMYYRWSYRRLTRGDGTLLLTPGPWTPLRRTVVRHYAMPIPGGVSHIPLNLGPHTIGSEANLFEIRPAAVPAGGIEWTVVDEREDLASAHFETDKLGTDELGSEADKCTKAFDSAGKYELKLELFKDTGALVDWTTEGIDPQITNVPAPFGINPVTSVSASDYHRIKDAAGHTVAFRMVLRVDNNCCKGAIESVEGVALNVTPCGFIEFAPGAMATLRFKAYHPNNFADFSFSVKRGVTDEVREASATGRTGSMSVPTNEPALPLHAYALTVPSTGNYRETFAVGELLGPCIRAAFSEALYVSTKATDGYGRLWPLDAFDHGGFALTPSP